MSADITEDFQVDLSNLAAEQVVTQNTDLEYSYAFNGVRFMDASSPNTPYRRETAQYQKDQTDDTVEAGEQSLLGWWLRSQSSFHFGSGIKFYEPAQDQSLRFRFADSQGINPWVKGQVSLLKDVDAVSGFTIAGSTKANLRTISTGVLVHDGSDVYKVSSAGVSTHLVDFAADVYTVTDDGKYLYWVANVSSKGNLYRKPLDSTTTSTEASLGDAVSIYDHPSATPSNTYMEFVKDRIIVASGNVVYKVDLDNSGTTKRTPVVFYTHPNTDYTFNNIVESPSDVYLSGFQGAKSAIYRVVFQDFTGLGLPEPVALQVVAEMPLGEQIYSLKYYLGYMVIGTSKGVRIAAVNDDGSITYGPLLFTSSIPVYQITASDRFVWVTAKIGTDCGLIRIDLSSQIETLVFPYANDLQALGDTDTCVGVAVLDNTGRIAFSAEGGNLYFESATEYRASGFLQTGLIRFNTLENKFFKYVRERAIYDGDTSVGISVNGQNVTIATSTSGNTDVGVPDKAAAESHYYTFTLYGDVADATKTPVFLGYQLKALPAVRRQRLVQYPLWAFDYEKDRVGNEYGFEGRAYQHLRLFETLEESSDIVTVQDFRTGEQFQALIEECSFSSTTPPDRHHSGFGGRLMVTVRKI